MSETPPIPAANDFIARIEIAKAGMPQVSDLPKVPDAGEIVEANDNRFQIMFNGVRVPADAYYGDWLTELIRQCKGHHEPQEEYAFHQVIHRAPAGATMIELGSYWAFYTTWFLTHVENSSAVIVEPDPANLPVALVTLAVNGCVAPVEFGVIGEQIPEFENVKIGGTRHFSVPVIQVDELMERHQLDHLYILHSDIQGAEVKMLEGAHETLHNKRVDYVFISTHGDEIHEQCLQILNRYDYRILVEHTMAESYSYDGLIVACSSLMNDFEIIGVKKRTASEWVPETPTVDNRLPLKLSPHIEPAPNEAGGCLMELDATLFILNPMM